MAVVESRLSRPAWRKVQLVGGVLLSLGLAVLSMIIERSDDALRLAALVALVGIGLVVGVEVRLRIEDIAARQAANAARQAAGAATLAEGQTKLQQQLGHLGAYAEASPSCREFLSKISEDWRRVEQRRSVILQWSRDDAENLFRTRLGELALGHAPLDILGRHNFRSHPLQDFKQIQSLNVATTEYWNSPRGRRYLRNQRTAIENGHLTASRIFVLGNGELQAASTVIRQNVTAGVRVSVVLREEIASDPDIPPLKDLSLVTDQTDVRGVFTPNAAGEAELFTTIEHEVRMAEDILHALEPYLHSVDEVFPNSPTGNGLRSGAEDASRN